MRVLELDMIQTVVLAAAVVFAGHWIRRRAGVLDRHNFPATVLGGLLCLAVMQALERTGILRVELDTALLTPLAAASFATIGLGLSVVSLRSLGRQGLRLWVLALLLATAQTAVGVGLANGFGLAPPAGLIAGPMTLTGGHGIGGAFGILLEGPLPGAVTFAMTLATAGVGIGAVLGPAVTGFLVRRHGLVREPDPSTRSVAPAAGDRSETPAEPAAYGLLKTLTVVLLAMAAGGLLVRLVEGNLLLPGYVAAMLAGAVVRNLFDVVRVTRIPQHTVEDVGTIALSLFVAMALLSVDISALGRTAAVLLAILVVQAALGAGFAALATFPTMGRDTDAAVIAGGHAALSVGGAAGAVADLAAAGERYGPAPRALRLVPAVGGTPLGFTVVLLVTLALNLMR
ncbi:MAG: sodium/glutamate symporter [Gemmatimonadales bacterium]